MRAEVSQPPTLAPGFALVTVMDPPELDPPTIAFSVENPPRGFLQEGLDPAWGTTHAWLSPASAIAGVEGLELTLGPERTWFMRPNVTYVMRLRDAGSTAPVMLRIAWKGIRMPSDPPQQLPKQPPAPPPPLVDQHPVDQPLAPPPQGPKLEAPVVEPPPAVIEPQPDHRSGRRLVFAGLGLLVLLCVAVGAWYALHSRPPDKVVAAPGPAPPSGPLSPPASPSGPLSPPAARAFLQNSPSSDATYAEAQRYLKDGSPDALQGSLILLSRAADAGNGSAQTALGRMYDPDTFTPQTSAMKAPDSDKALLWYRRAATSNDPEGLYRLGMLLMSGHAAAPGLGPEQGAADLQRAAELGNSDARAAIDKLRNKQN
jgi:hypothetical protein